MVFLMKKFKRLFLSLGIFFTLILVTAVLFATGVLRPAMFGTFELAKDSRREFVVEQPMLATATKLTTLEFQKALLQRLGVTVLESESLDFLSLLKSLVVSGKLETEKEMKVEMNDSRMGRMVFLLRTKIKGDLNKILVVTELTQPTELVKSFEQRITLTPEGKGSGGGVMSVFGAGPRKTKFEIAYSSNVVVPYPGFSFVRSEADRHVGEQHERVLNVMEELFREFAGK